MIKAILIGSTGMIGKGVLLESLENPLVESVLVINRHSCGIKHPKLKEVIHKNFLDLSPIENDLSGYNSCFFCLGVSAAGMSEQDYHKVTFDLTIHVAETLLKLNKDLTFCYISGAGTDRTEKGRMMWARVKGKTENTLLAMPFKNAYMFRPGYIQPMKGIKSRTKLYNIFYTVFKPLYFLLKPFKGLVTNTTAMARAMINAVAKGYPKSIIESSEINKLGQ